MHLASILGLLDLLAPLGRIIPVLARGEFVLNLAGMSMILMALLSGIFFVLCFKFFLDARKARLPAAEKNGRGE